MNEISNNDLIDAMKNCGIEGCEWNGQPWFNGIDVALWLGYDDPDAALQDIVDSQDKRYDADGSLLINEFGVVSLIFSSTLPDVVASKEEELQKIREEADRSDTEENACMTALSHPAFGLLRGLYLDDSGKVYLFSSDLARILGLDRNAVAASDGFALEGNVINPDGSLERGQLVTLGRALQLTHESRIENPEEFVDWLTIVVKPRLVNEAKLRAMAREMDPDAIIELLVDLCLAEQEVERLNKIIESKEHVIDNLTDRLMETSRP